MNNLLFFIAILFVFKIQAQNHNTDYVIFSGNITNANQKVFVLKGLEEKSITKLLLDDKGNFIDTVYTKEQKFVLNEGINNAYIKLSPGDNIKLEADAKDFLNSLHFFGKGADLNNYLVGAENLYNEENQNYKEKYSKSEEEFTVFKKGWKKERLVFLKSSKGLPSEFVEIEKRNIYYCYARDFINYERNHANYVKGEKFKVSENFLDEFENLNWENEQDYKDCHFYPHLIRNRITNNFNKESKDNHHNLVALLEYINSNVHNQYIKDQLLYKSSEYNITYTENLEEFYKVFSKGIKNEELKSEITKTYVGLSLLAKGKKSPKFINYENYNGATNSLEDYFGKFIYIDVWASWCQPCINEISDLKKLNDEFNGKNIEFISISVDPPSYYDKWRKVIMEKGMSWTQLSADKDWGSEFIKAYLIKGVPRYILIDPKGNIIDSNAPRPSDSKLRELFNSLDI